MKSLVIGNTSQLSFYFPGDFTKISSRNLDFSSIKKKEWDRIILSFGESRKFIDSKNLYEDVNFHLTVKTVEELKDSCNSLVVYSTCELWNKYVGQIDISMPFSFYETPYLISKYKMSSYLLDKSFKNVYINFPFNFNSIKRNNNFLFGKVFDSIINKKKIVIGDTYFYRDMIHPSYVVKESIDCKENKVIGSGRLTFVNDFIRILYSSSNLVFEDLVTEQIGSFSEYKARNEYYLKTKTCNQTYEQLVHLTLEDLRRIRC